MYSKMTAKDAARCLGLKEPALIKQLQDNNLPFAKSGTHVYFGHLTAKSLFGFQFFPRVVVFQIVKGGTGKTSLAHEFAVRANLYGARVLCIDLDQQGNLTHAFNIDANEQPVMVDILAEGYSLDQAIIEVGPGLDLLSSRIENALLNEVIRLKKLDLEEVYLPIVQELKQDYDLILIDCPPNLDQSVAAATLAADLVVSPVVPERFALEGLRMTCESICELENTYDVEIPFNVVINKYDGRTTLSQDALEILMDHPLYEGRLFDARIRMSQDFPNAIAKGQSIFDAVKPSLAKSDVDSLTQEILDIRNLPRNLKKSRVSKARAKLRTTPSKAAPKKSTRKKTLVTS